MYLLLYDVTYKEDGTIDAMTPIYDDVPKTVRKEIVLDMTGAVYPERPLVPHIRAVQDRVCVRDSARLYQRLSFSARLVWFTVLCVSVM